MTVMQLLSSSGSFGVLDNRFLARSIGLLNPDAPAVVNEEEPVSVAVEALKDFKQGCVVITNSLNEIVGIFSERDVVLKVVGTDLPIHSTPISQVMTPNPKTANMTTSIAFALNMMSQGGYRHIPIVDNDEHPVGMITVKNLIDYIVSSVTKDLGKV